MIRVSSMMAAGVLLMGSVCSAEIKSGIPVGQSVKSFDPHNVTGPNAGESACLVWSNGSSPVVAIFARDVDDSLAGLVKKIDEATIKNKKLEMGSFVVVLDKSDAMEKKVKGFGEKIGVKETILALDKTEGPKGYNISKDAHVTVMLYVGRKVKANFVFEKGKLTEADVEKILKDLPKILEE